MDPFYSHDNDDVDVKRAILSGSNVAISIFQSYRLERLKEKKKKTNKKKWKWEKTEKELTLLASSGKKRSDKRVTNYRDQPVYYKYFL